MKQCPECGHGRAYKLKDGRMKCRACGHRFSWTCVWDSVRLPASTKRHLLEQFALGVPAYRQRFASDTSDVSRERFYRLLRACCARAEQMTEPFETILEGGDKSELLRPHEAHRQGGHRMIVVGLVNLRGRIRAHPVTADDGHVLLRRIGAAQQCDDVWIRGASQSYALLNVRGESVATSNYIPSLLGQNRLDVIDGFWSHACASMRVYRTVSRRYVHLYLAEACYRYNHRERDLRPLLLGLTRTLSIQELRPVLGRSA